jgi:hypothetical protein
LFQDSDLISVVDRIRKASMKYNTLEDFGIDILSKLDPKAEGFISKNQIQNSLKE